MVNNIRISPLITSTSSPTDACRVTVCTVNRPETSPEPFRGRVATRHSVHFESTVPRSSTSYQHSAKATHTVLRPLEILDRYNFSLSIDRNGRFGTLTLSQTKRTPINMSTSMCINISLTRGHTVDCSLGYLVSGKQRIRQWLKQARKQPRPRLPMLLRNENILAHSENNTTKP